MVNNKAIRDFKRRLCVAEHENERMQYKAMTHDRNLPLEVRRYFESKLNALPKNSSITRVRNRCIITGRSRSVYRKFRMSRICLREMAGRHELMGLYKASW
ncbi:hypothetical protein SELMODRAFT_97235 [Selaginella moellendorffii]|uniref:Small ribosomal subunit protein uS14m n=2 Tax=Selaginella moellendorffii TaxID=88036 RepID=D8RMW8_SELML|nr:hypothetical protein SELMODRAFT_135507 [Selaginella moellendorffii]EFJ26608.1 hypothetical protein SELMODRAFT_97235 [Selaginella moellendorffii]